MLRFAVALLLASTASAQVEPRLDLEPLSAEIGQPVTLILTVEHAPGVELELPEEIVPDDSWVLYGEANKVTLPHPDREGRAVTVARWEISSLEPGERTIEFAQLKWSEGESSGVADVAAATLQVAAALAEGEDDPRPALTFRDPLLPEAPITHWPLVAGGAVALALVWWLVRRRRSVAGAKEVVLSPLAALEVLEQNSGELGIRDTYFELSRLVRRAFDEGGEDHVGLTDEEWLAELATDERSSVQEREALAALLARCEEVKYAQAEPTRWALEESIATAKELAGKARREPVEVAA